MRIPPTPKTQPLKPRITFTSRWWWLLAIPLAIAVGAAAVRFLFIERDARRELSDALIVPVRLAAVQLNRWHRNQKSRALTVAAVLPTNWSSAERNTARHDENLALFARVARAAKVVDSSDLWLLAPNGRVLATSSMDSSVAPPPFSARPSPPGRRHRALASTVARPFSRRPAAASSIASTFASRWVMTAGPQTCCCSARA
jgi:hypothetical protein